MASRRYIALIACLLVTATLWGQSKEKSTLRLWREGDSTIVVSFTMGKADLETDEDGWQRLACQGMICGTGEPGSPNLPVATALLPLAKDCKVVIEDISSQSDTPIVIERALAPVCESWVKDAPPPVASPDKGIYGQNNYYRGGEQVEVTELGVMGEHRLFRVTVRPVAYQPQQKTLLKDSQVTARLRVITLPTTKSHVEDPNKPSRYLIVSRPRYREGLQPFVEWKRQEGFDVRELYVTTHRRDTVKSEVDRFVASLGWDAPDYMLLAGDAADLQAFIGNNHPSELSDHLTDLPYADFSGDHLPDTRLGRWPVEDTAQLGAVVRKTLAYEQGTALDSAALRRVLLVAGRETASVAPTTTNGQVNYLAREIRAAHPGTDTLCHRNPQSGDELEAIAGEIGGGVSLVNYTAHCTVGGWNSPALNAATLNSIGNHFATVYVNNCCKSNDFGGTCFGEMLLRQEHGGAVGVVGATNSTLWNEDYYWAVGPKWPIGLESAFDSLRPGAFDQWIGRMPRTETLGGLMTAGGLALEAMGSRHALFYWETYTLFGDPSLRPWTELPRRAFVWSPDTLESGITQTRISGTPGATVSAIQGGELIGVLTLDSMRSHLFRFSHPLDTLPVLFTATGAGMLPAHDTSMIQRVATPAVTFRHIVTLDSVIHMELGNVGEGDIDSLWVVWRCSCLDDSTDCAVTESLRVGPISLSRHGEAEVRVPINVLVDGPEWYGTLTARSTDTLLHAPEMVLRHRLEFTPAEVILALLKPDGTAATSLDTLKDYLVLAATDRTVDTLRLCIVAEPSETVLADTVVATNSLRVTVTTSDTLTRLRLATTTLQGRTTRHHRRWMVAGRRSDGFEEGFGSYPWQRPGLEAWTLDSTTTHSGRFSARSGAIGHSQQSDLVLTVVVPSRDSISFWARTSSEAQYDMMEFHIDGRRMGYSLFGNTAWKRFAYVLEPGRHELKWRYFKNGSVSSGGDCAWVDDVRLPLALWEEPCGYFDTAASGGISIVHASATTNTVLRPNPALNWTELVLGTDMETSVEVTLRDLYGRRLQTFTTCQPSVMLDLGGLPSGVYLVTVSTPNRQIVKKLTINNP